VLIASDRKWTLFIRSKTASAAPKKAAHHSGWSPAPNQIDSGPAIPMCIELTQLNRRWPIITRLFRTVADMWRARAPCLTRYAGEW